LIVAGVIAAFCAATGSSWLGVNVLLFIAMFPVATACHELGHALTASLLDFDVFRISLGAGPKRFERRWLGYRWVVRRFLNRGQCSAAARGERFVLARNVAFILGGAAANLLLAAMGWVILSYSGYEEHAFADVAPLAVFALVNGLTVAVSLVPYTARDGTRSDGMLVAVALRHRSRQRSIYVELNPMLKFLELREIGRGDEALADLERAGARFPENRVLGAVLGVGYLDARRPAEARSALEIALAHAPDPGTTAVVQNNLAYLGLLTEDAADLAKGRSFSALAYAALPWEPAVAGTRAAYLILEQLPVQAIAAIEQTLDEEMRDTDRKVMLDTLALAHERAGNSARAATLRRKAASLAGSSELDLTRIVLPSQEPPERAAG
jgi:hypothetical protein